MLVQLFRVIVCVIHLQFQFEAPRIALLLLNCHWSHLDRGCWKNIWNHLLLGHHLPNILSLQWRCDHLLLLLLADDSVEAKLESVSVIFVQRQSLFLFIRDFLKHRGYILLLWSLFLLFIFVLEKLEDQGHDFFEHLLLLFALDQL
jgi:hypothetical protein